MDAETYKQILGVRTKGGFPTIIFKEFIDLEQIEGDQRFYDKKTGDYLVVKDRIVYLWNDGQSSLDDFDIAKQHIHKAIFPNDTMTAEERFAHSRKVAGLEPRKSKEEKQKVYDKVAELEKQGAFAGKDGIYVPIFDTTMEKSRLDEFKKTMKEMGIEQMQEQDIDEFIRNMDGASR